MVTSNVYCLTSSSAEAANAERGSAEAAPRVTHAATIDPENRWYWRMNSLRMEAQAVRDSLLALAGELDQRMGGPPVPANAETPRRSLYFFHSHNEQNTFLEIFDDASVLECYRRAESVVPQQALALQNSRLALAAAEKIARRVEGGSDAAFVRAAFEALLGSTPTAEEQSECEKALKELRDLAAQESRPDAAGHARETLVHALLNHNDFVTIR